MKIHNKNSILKRIGVLLLAATLIVTTSSFSSFAMETEYTSETASENQIEANISEIEPKETLGEDLGETNEQSSDTLSEETSDTNETADKDIPDENTSEETINETVTERTEEYAFEDSVTVDGVVITVTADAGVFPVNAYVQASKVSDATKQEALEAVDEIRDESKKVAVSYTFDISIYNENGEKVEPDNDKGSVKVTFEMAEVENDNLDTVVYHVEESEGAGDELEATELDTEVHGDELTATTDGFSIYTVEFTYGTLTYVLDGDETVELMDILDAVGLEVSGGIDAVKSSNESLFIPKQENGKWYVTSLKAFNSDEWLKVTIDGIEYEIVATDDNGSGYCQVKSDNFLGFRNTPFVGSFNPSSATNAVFVDDKSKVASSTNHILSNGKSVVIKFPAAYTYFDTTVYDVYVEVTARMNYTKASWMCKGGTESDASYIKLKPYSGTNDFDYKVWLQPKSDEVKVDENAIVKGIALVGGSCYTANSEGARPYSDDGYIYTNVDNPKTSLEYVEETTGTSPKTVEIWRPTSSASSAVNKYNIRILGHGTDDKGVIYGGYYGTSGDAEIVLGYLSRDLKINIDNKTLTIPASDGYPIGKSGADYINNNKTEITGWKANKDVTLDSGETIQTGKSIPKDTLQYVIVEEGLELTAITTPSYEVSFNLNYADAPTNPDSITVFKGDAYGTLPTPADRVGYTFDGWYTNATGGTKVESTTLVDTDTDHTLYAHWSVKSYTLTFDPMGGSVTETSRNITYGSTYGDLPTPTKTGYTFAGWYTGQTDGTKIEDSSTYNIDGDQEIYAHWTVNTYTVTYNANDGTVSPESSQVTYGGTYGSLPTPTRAGYDFAGWYTELTDGTEVTPSTTVTTADDHTIYAHWTAKTCTVTYDPNGGYVSKTSDTVTYGEVYGALPTPTYVGHTFKGWSSAQTGGTEITSTTTVFLSTDHKIFALWDDDNITVSMENYTYGTSNLPAAAITYTGSGTVKYYYSTTDTTTGGTEWTESMTGTSLNAGTYYMYAVITGADGTKYTTPTDSFTVDKAASSCTPPEALDLTYNGNEQTLISAGSATGGTMEYSFDGTQYSSELPKKTDADTYPIYYRVKGDDNHKDYVATEPVNAKIKKADCTVTPPTDKGNLYTGSELELVSPATATGGTVLYSLNDPNTGFSTEIPKGTEAKEYTVYYKVEPDNNHNGIGVQSVKATISKNARSAVDVVMDGYKYGQTTPIPTPTLSDNPAENPTITYYYYPAGHPELKTEWTGVTSKTLDAGEYVMIAVIGATDNYGSLTTAEKSFTVAKGDYTLSSPTQEYTFGEKIGTKEPLGGSATAQDGDSTEITGTFTWTSAVTVIMPHVSDSNNTLYQATFTPSGDFAKNYDVKDCDCKVTVNPKEANPSELNMKLEKDGQGGYDVTEAITGEIVDLDRDVQYTVDIQPHENKDKDGKVTDIDYVITYTFKGDFTGTIVKKVNMPVPKENPAGENPESSILARVDREDEIISKYDPKLEAPDYADAKKIIDTDFKENNPQPEEMSDVGKIAAKIDTQGAIIYDANVYIEVTQPVEGTVAFEQDKAKAAACIAENIKNAGDKVAYIDISMFTTYKLMDAEDTSVVYEESKSQIHETEKYETITIDIPEELRSYPSNVVRTYYITRVHEGNAEILTDAIVANGKITFKTRLFSTYAIAYSDAAKPTPPSDPGSNDGGSSSSTVTMASNTVSPVINATGVVSPKTADTAEVVVFIMMLMAGVVVLISSRKNKKA